ncbi:MAG: hypothetical protein NZM26_00805 [Patescibacteria group bacterium]|nr:hypothetical protein [Patescibacteria group bacterium]
MDQVEIPEVFESTDRKSRIEELTLPNGCNVVISGVRHTTSLHEIDDALVALRRFVEQKGKENLVFLGEGSAVKAGMAKDSVEMAILGGDQQALACQAKELGVKVIDSWDMSFEEQLVFVKNSFGAKNAFLWMLSQASIHLYNQGNQPNIDNFLSMMGLFGMDKDSIVEILKDEDVVNALKSNQDGDAFLKSMIGFSLSDINENDKARKDFLQVANPLNTDEEISKLSEELRDAAQVARELNKERDRRFKEKVKQYVDNPKSAVFISCGKSHVDDFLGIVRELQGLQGSDEEI